jgi:alkanesulfonate monooxygenase SsuD/methylene tetrahydromethanopterin reductase-like flavin-dependent oxidoreductase (luciferase family)
MSRPAERPRSPQGRPVICQAGGSPRGQQFAARWADTIITDAGSVEAMKEYRTRVRANTVAAGRDPDRLKLLFLAYPLIDTTMEAAQERRRLLLADAGQHIEMALSSMSRLTNIDFAKFDLDEPLPEVFTNGHQSSLAKWIGKTPRELPMRQNMKMGIDFTGTSDHVAGMMQEIMEEVGGDGFLFFNAAFDRRYVMEVCDGLVPELQRRGLTRTGYAHKHFRDNLMEF